MLATLTRNSTNVRNAVALAKARMHFAIASALAPERAVETAARLFTTPPRFPHTAAELELLATGTRFEVRDGELSLMAWRFGRADRPVVLLSHGWGGRGAQFRAFVAPLVAAGYQVVLFDHVGHGHSGGVASSIVHFVRGIEAVARHVEHRGMPIAGVVGHSLGAAALGAWLNGNGREIRAVLVAAPISLQRYSRFFARRLGVSERVRGAMQERFERMLGRPWSDFELPDSVARVKAPALVIHDRVDGDIPVASGMALARAWPGARFVATRGLGHRRILRDETVARDVADFIADRVVFPRPPESAGARAFSAPAPIL